MTDDQLPKFSCRRVTVHFIYSLAVSSDAENPTQEQPTTWTVGTPEQRTGIVPHLSLKEGSRWTATPARHATVCPSAKRLIPGFLSSVGRHFPTSATFTFSFETPGDHQGDFDTGDVLSILGLVVQRQGSNKESTIQLQGEPPSSLYDCFRQAADSLCTGAISWLDKTKDVLDTARETQSPWVVTVAEVSEQIASAFCAAGDAGDDPARTKMLRVRKYESDIAPILFRSVSQELVLEPAYVQSPTQMGVPGLYSVNVDARLFVCMSRRAILCICRQRDDDPAKYFLPGLLDICELVRARWHALVVLNKLLDRTIFKIRRCEGSRTDRQSQLMEMRGRLAACLEDPTLYIVAGDALSKLYADLRDMFRLEELRNTLLAKIDLADKVYSDSQELEWIKSRDLDTR